MKAIILRRSRLFSGWILTVITLMGVTDVPPLVDHVDAGLDAELAVRVSASPPPPHREAVHRVVVELVILVQEGVVHGQLLLRVVDVVCVVPRQVALCMNILVGPVVRGGGEGSGGFPLEVVEQAGRRGLHNQVVSDGSVLENNNLYFNVLIAHCVAAGSSDTAGAEGHSDCYQQRCQTVNQISQYTTFREGGFVSNDPSNLLSNISVLKGP